MFSDAGSQLVGANAELLQAWKALNHDELVRYGSDKRMEWRFGAADSPWYQGAVESLVKTAKQAIDPSVKGVTTQGCWWPLSGCHMCAWLALMSYEKG